MAIVIKKWDLHSYGHKIFYTYKEPIDTHWKKRQHIQQIVLVKLHVEEYKWTHIYHPAQNPSTNRSISIL